MKFNSKENNYCTSTMIIYKKVIKNVKKKMNDIAMSTLANLIVISSLESYLMVLYHYLLLDDQFVIT